MTAAAKNWKHPPITEVVLGVQFQPIPTLSTAHLGWFWSTLREEYPHPEDIRPVEPAVYQDTLQYGVNPDFELGFMPVSCRIRARSEDRNRIIQIQNGWFLVNWAKRKDSVYPGFKSVQADFVANFNRFSQFIETAVGVVPVPNLWELTYIDHVEEGMLWQSPLDFHKVFPGLLGNMQAASARPEAMQGNWSFKLQKVVGRLDFHVKSAMSTTTTPKKLLVMQATARGPIGNPDVMAVADSIDAAHEGVTSTFEEMASAEALKFWKGGHS
jgi:uncharacterized protein (TIGR04255 family)